MDSVEEGGGERERDTPSTLFVSMVMVLVDARGQAEVSV
jgi:hypothetical protein